MAQYLHWYSEKYKQCKHTVTLRRVVRGQVQSILDFGPVVKPLGITVKKEVGKVVETSDVVRSQVTREY